jgi:acyl-[acyl-carrier-protein]-phospholipid O-acyltransferase/long-chain-fatty-acid--[acyl-carrier-protein] ligase
MGGYLNDEEKTNSVIVEQDGIRWYKTGDKGVLDEDGFLTILDRYSRFAKLGGEMISLGSVEETIAKIINNEEVEIAAVALPDEKKGEKILLLISGDVESVDLKQKLIDEKISPLMIPQEFIKVEGIPKLGSGKTDFSSVKKLAVEMAG